MPYLQFQRTTHISRMNAPIRNQARRYTVEEWEQMKPKIRDLIVNEKQKLKDIMRILEEDLGFVVRYWFSTIEDGSSE